MIDKSSIKPDDQNYYPRLDPLNLGNVPNSLKEIAAWVCWREVPARNPKAKPRKVPVNPATLANASSTDPTTWGTFSEAADAFTQNPELAGIGFVFSEAENFAGIDADNCIDPKTGALDSGTAELVRLVSSYTEVSPSLKGIKIYVKAKFSGDGNTFEFKGREFQIYDTGRYFAVTGLRLPDSLAAIWDRQQIIDSLLPPDTRSSAFAAPPKPRTEDPRTALVDAIPDDELIAKIENSKQGEKFKQLMGGSKVGYPGYFAASGALCAILAAWTRANPERIDRIYRNSEMCAPREWWWDERAYKGGRTRGEVTIEKACALASGRRMYDPRIDERVIVVVEDGETPTAIDEAEAALIPTAADRGIFQRAEVVRVITLPEPLASRGLARPAGTVMLAPMTADALAETLERSIKFKHKVLTSEGFKEIPVNCPARLARMYLARRQWKLSILTGIIEPPCLRPDGTVLTEPGYDQTTGLYLSTAEEWPAIGNPDRDAARAALRMLLYPFRQFPFVDADGEPPPPMGDDNQAVENLIQSPSAAVFVTGILTALQRRLLESAPIYGFSAPQPRYGKSMLARAIAIIATGRSAPAASLGADADEIRKMILGVLREGQWRGSRANPVNLAGVLDEIVASLKWYRVHTIYGDQFCSEPIRQALAVRGIKFEQRQTLGRGAGCFPTLRTLITSQKILLLDDEGFLSELKNLQLIATSGGNQRVEAAGGGKDDRSVALALAAHECVLLPVRNGPLVTMISFDAPSTELSPNDSGSERWWRPAGGGGKLPSFGGPQR